MTSAPDGSTPAPPPSPVPTDAAGNEFATDQVLVKISPKSSRRESVNVLETFGKVKETELEKLGYFLLEVPRGTVQWHVSQLQSLPGVIAAEPNYWLSALDTLPNDPGWPNQYALPAIRAPQGWDLSTGSPAITIAVVDSGVDLGHPDLAGKLLPGYDFVNNDNIPQDDYGHGTHVAGIAAASTNNGTGVAGVSWQARILPVKVLNSSGSGSYLNTAAGIVWAVDRGASIINLSLGGISPSTVLEDAVNYAVGNGALVVAATGNYNSSIFYPARYPAVMAVAATDSANQRYSLSNYGPEVDIAAPGVAIYGLNIAGYTTRTGTSMAAPHVAGLAAILFGYTNNAAAVENYMEATALDLDSAGWDIYTGAGLIQMDKAIQQATNTLPESTSTATVPPGQPVPNLPGNAATFTPVPTWTPAATNTTTLTPSGTPTPLTPASLPGTETPTSTTTPSPRTAALATEKLERLKVLLSPMFCCGAGSVLLGMFLIFKNSRKGKKKSDKF